MQGWSGARATFGLALGFAGVLSVSGCAPPNGYALQMAGLGPEASRAQLQGPIAFVDGEDVSEHGDLFVLPVGCHVVTTVSKWADADTQGGVTVQLRPLTYAISMEANHYYVVRFSGGSANMLNAHFSVEASDSDATREHIRKLEPATQDDISSCRAWQQSASANEQHQ